MSWEVLMLLSPSGLAVYWIDGESIWCWCTDGKKMKDSVIDFGKQSTMAISSVGRALYGLHELCVIGVMPHQCTVMIRDWSLNPM